MRSSRTATFKSIKLGGNNPNTDSYYAFSGLAMSNSKNMV